MITVWMSTVGTSVFALSLLPQETLEVLSLVPLSVDDLDFFAHTIVALFLCCVVAGTIALISKREPPELH